MGIEGLAESHACDTIRRTPSSFEKQHLDAAIHLGAILDHLTGRDCNGNLTEDVDLGSENCPVERLEFRSCKPRIRSTKVSTLSSLLWSLETMAARILRALARSICLQVSAPDWQCRAN